MSKQTEGFELWEGRRAAYSNTPGKMLQSGTMWVWIADGGHNVDGLSTFRSEAAWKDVWEQRYLTFSNEHPGYERVVVKHFTEVRAGDIFKCADGHLRRPVEAEDLEESGDDYKPNPMNLLIIGLVVGVGWVLRKEEEEA